MTQASEQWLDGGAGKIFVRQWEPDAAPKANLVICHGFNAHSGQYNRVAETFTNHGYAVTAADLRGRGKSDGERFYVESIDDYVADLSLAVELARRTHPDLPTHLLGHSAGGVTAVAFALDHQDRIDGLISEDFAFRVFAPDFALKLLEAASHIVPHAHALKLPMEAFTRDPDWLSLLKADPLTLGESQPVETLAALARAAERFEREFPKITLPLLILHGTGDKATRPDGSQQFFDEAGSTDKTLKLYDGHFHDLLNDLGREEVFGDIVDWIDQRLSATQKAPIPGATLPA